MKYTSLVIATIFTCSVAPTLEASVAFPSSAASTLTATATLDTQIIQIEAKKGKGGEKNKAQKEQKKPEQGKDSKKHDEVKGKVKRSKDERVRDADAILAIRAPDGRDMTVLLGSFPLALLGTGVVFADVPEDQLLTYRNCPPGLAKMDPPCVPPGLAKKGVTYEEWVTYDDKRLDEIYLDHRSGYLDQDAVLDDDILLLNSTQIASLYGLRPAVEGTRYGLIDGQPVLLTDEDNRSLLSIRDLDRSANLPAGLLVSPTAALTQNELRQTYNLPILDSGYNYAVVNGELVTLEDSAFEALQLIRIARAVF